MRTLLFVLVSFYIGASLGNSTTMGQVKQGRVRTTEATYNCIKEVVHAGNTADVSIVDLHH